MLATKYCYEIADNLRGGYDIRLFAKDNSKEFTFYSAGGVKEFLVNHMNSLTDDCCKDLLKGK